jgi:HK97 gp10 family phage protein
MEIKINPKDQKQLARKFKKLLKVDNAEAHRILNEESRAISSNAQKDSPIDTGNLRRNIGYDYRRDKKEAIIYAKAPYSGYLEYGTRFQPAQPYFEPNVNKGIKRIIRRFEIALKNALNKS